MTNHIIPIDIVFIDTADVEHQVVVNFEGSYASGGAIAGDMVNLAKLGEDKLKSDPKAGPLIAAGDLTVIGISKVGECKRFVVSAIYENGSPFGDAYQAVDADCAELQALWSMACNHYEGGDTPLADMVEYMIDCSVIDAEPEPVSKADQRRFFIDLVEAVRNGGDVDGALTAAEGALVAMGDIEPRMPAFKL